MIIALERDKSRHLTGMFVVVAVSSAAKLAKPTRFGCVRADGSLACEYGVPLTCRATINNAVDSRCDIDSLVVDNTINREI